MASEQKTRCPHCQTTFRVQKNQLEAASGMVRCGKCYQAFNGLKCLLESEKPAAATGDDDDFLIDDNFDLSRLEQLDRKPASAPARKPAASAQGAQSNASQVPRPDGGTAPADDTEEIVFVAGSPVTENGEQLEELSLDQGAMSRWRPETHNIIPDAGLIGRHPSEAGKPFSWLWIAGSIGAAVVLAVQLIYFNSLSVSRDSAFWPLTSTLCPLMGCPLPRQVDMDKILSTNLVIRNHPDVNDALLVDAVIVNTAEFSQPFPPLTLAFENLQGNTVARRTFQPPEYLTGELSGLSTMPARQPIKLELEIVDPGTGAVSFRFFVAR